MPNRWTSRPDRRHRFHSSEIAARRLHPRSERQAISAALAATRGERARPRKLLQNQPHHALPQNERIQAGLEDRTGRHVQRRRALSGVGLYSREILFGLAAAHPETRFDFCYRPHRYLRAGALPPNARRRLLARDRDAPMSFTG